jgi:hypothetical protein
MNGDAPGYRTGNISDAANEAGASDNNLNLNVGDDRWKDILAEWQDGQTYDIKGGKIQQVTPGKFRVLELDLGQAGTNEETEANEAGKRAAEKDEAEGTREYSNPAVENLMATEERR